MKISSSNMEKLGFQKFGATWQHKRHTSLKYKRPTWAYLINDIYIKAYIHGKEDNQMAIRKQLGISGGSYIED